ncbi:MAG: ATPase, T2SS/T4P/T4SS family [Thermodesulfobacteriota bacterium]
MAVKKIGELLVESGLITEEQLEEALAEGRSHKGERIGAILVKKGYATEMDIAQTLAFQLSIPFVELATANIDPEAVRLVDEQLAKKYLVFPHYRQKKTLSLAMADPLNLRAIDDIRFSTGMEIRPSAATIKDITDAIGRFHHMGEPIEDLIGDLGKDRLVEVIHEADSSRDLTEQVKKSSAPPIIKMVDSIIIHAYDSKASDIHIEPRETMVKLRLRVDGIMSEAMKMPKWVQGPVTSRIKLMARMDIAERRVSQDGRLKVRVGEKALDIRVSTLPTQYGETVVLRLLDPRGSLVSLDNSGLGEEDLARVADMIERPQGVVLVTGPTGCGKSSTLYGMISYIKTEKINIITIEDPIEYELKDVNQVAVNEKTGLTFSYTLRSVLRQDPDVILVGETRDTETAVIAHQASITGHLVFTTLHTNDAVSSITRLKNMGVPGYMIGSALNGIVAQRLVRTICARCREPYKPTPEELRRAGIKLDGKDKLFRGAGCSECGGSGYSGRTGVFEILSVDTRIRKLIISDAPEQEIMHAALDSGMRPLHVDGLKKVTDGVTTIEELTRVIYLSRDEDEQMGLCPSCDKPAPIDARRCPHCEAPIVRECASCGKMRQPDWVACPYCGKDF